MEDNGYYVYVHRRMDTGTIFYVGKGRGGRMGNPYRNAEHDYIVHYLQENGFGMETEKIADNLTEAEAFDVECRTICKYIGEGYGLNGKHLELGPDKPYLTSKNFGSPIGVSSNKYQAYGGKLSPACKSGKARKGRGRKKNLPGRGGERRRDRCEIIRGHG